MKSQLKKSLLIALFSIFIYSFTHKFYVSVFIIEHNEKNKTLEITSQVFLDDMEMMFRNKNIELDLYSTSDIISDSLIKDYFKSVFKIKKNSEILEYEFLGKELFDDILNFYIEVKDINYKDSLIIQNKLLIDLYDSQKNIIHFKSKNNNKSFLMNYKKTEIQLNLS
ncbi:MAG: hypothetical protein CMC33_03255 [Flavobacteriaceae bacterium]|nr:hypothetical protein [Flavobacteriaceae bacterium]|tara:strand:+ start:2944 stop:3444 length:501 start_codon:yes stop_codon:yes gene_type:complete